jgi:hypothetical protein
VCGNLENGIAIGKPRIYDDRTLELLIRSLESQKAALGSHEDPELTRNIASLRSLADRALSDRVLTPPAGGTPVPRAQALIGFQISLDAKEKYAGAVAEIDVTLTTKSEPHQPPALISILPKDPGGDGVAIEKVVPTREPMKYCTTGYRESDRDLTFGWQFSPRSDGGRVEPGTRQVYAMVALPSSTSEEYLADLHVHSHWRPVKRVKHKSKIDLQEESTRDELVTDAIRFNPAEMELTLRPRVNGVRFALTGEKDVLVVADGENFLPDTQLSIGAVTLPASAVQIERERVLQFGAAAPALMQSDPYITARYGSPVPLVDPRALSQQWTSDPSWGLKVEYARARPKDHNQSELRIKIKSRRHKKPLDDLIVNATLVNVAGGLFKVSATESDPTDSDALLLRFELPTAALRAAPKLTIARLLGGELFRDSADVVLEDDITVSHVSVLSSTEDEVMLGIGGAGFSNLAVVQISGTSYTRWTQPGIVVNSSNMITLRVKRNMLDGVRQLTVAQGFATPAIVPIPEDLAPQPAAPRSKPKREKRR